MSIIVKSGVPGKVPTSAQLDYGQLALNYADQKIYFKNSSNQIVQIGGGGTYTEATSYTSQDTTGAPFFATATLTGSAYAPSTKIRVTGATKTATISYGTLHNPDNTVDAVIHRIDAGDVNNRSWRFTESGDFISPGNVTAYSDIRLKLDIVTIRDALLKIKQISGYTYLRTDLGTRQAGVIAQEIEKVLPEAVISSNGLLSVSYGNLTALLIQSIKELDEKLQIIERKLDAITRIGYNKS